jgi:phage gp36-like protein
MASYCTPEDLGRYGINSEALEGIPDVDGQRPPIEGTSDYMDGYLGKQFTLPLLAFGDDIRECCAVITSWRILRVRGLKPGENPEDNALYLDYKEKIRWLEQIAAGKVTPVVTPSPTPGTGGSVTPGGPMVLSNESRGWQDDVGASPSGVPFAGRRRS